MESDEYVLNLSKISKCYVKGKQALSEITFSLGHQEILGVVGPNGAGKSTLFNILAMIHKRD